MEQDVFSKKTNPAPMPFRRRTSRYGRGRRLRGRGRYYGIYRRIGGRGSYLTDAWKRYRKYVPRAIGAGYGAVKALTMGGGLGGALQQGIRGWHSGADYSKKILGWGRYTQSPWKGTPNGGLITKGHVPSMHSAGENGVRVTHRECIGLVTSSAAFNCEKFELNPGLPGTFPWLSSIAGMFQQYNINGLVIVYKPTCSEGGGVDQAIVGTGSVCMCASQNVMAVRPGNLEEMLQTQFSASATPYGEIVMPIEQDKRYGGRPIGELLVRRGEVPVGGTKQMYDDCVVYVATDSNGVDGQILGQLFVSYDVTLYAPTFMPAGSYCYSYDAHHVNCRSPLAGAHIQSPVGVSTTNYDDIGVTIGCLTEHPEVVVYHFEAGNAGKFLLQTMWYTRNEAMANQCTIPIGDDAVHSMVNCRAIHYMIGNPRTKSAIYLPAPMGEISRVWIFQIGIEILDANKPAQFYYGVQGGTVEQHNTFQFADAGQHAGDGVIDADVWITQMDPSFGMPHNALALGAGAGTDLELGEGYEVARYTIAAQTASGDVFGTNAAGFVKVHDTMGITRVSATELTIPLMTQGKFKLTYLMEGKVAAGTEAPVFTALNDLGNTVEAGEVVPGKTQVHVPSAQATCGNVCTVMYMDINPSRTPITVELSSGGTWTDATGGSLVISRVHPDEQLSAPE